MGALATFLLSFTHEGFALDANLLSEKSKSNKQISIQLTQNKVAKVIVILNVENSISKKWEANLSISKNRMSTEAEIKARSNLIAEELGILSSESYTPFSTVAAFAAQLTADQINKLLKDERVRSIENDMEMVKHLDITIPYIQSPAAVSRGATGLNTSIVVIDDGIQRNHPFIGTARIAREACFLDYAGCPNGTNADIGTGAAAAAANASHGTHVAGIALGSQASGSPRRGVAFRSRVIPINIFGTRSSTSFSTIQRAFEHVDSLSASSA